MKKNRILLPAAALFALASGLHAQTIINADPADDEFVLMTASGASTRAAHQDSSAGWNNGTARSTVFLFELTNITDTITDADFTTFYRQIAESGGNTGIENTDVSLFATTLNGKTLSTDYFIAPQDLSGNITVGSVEWTSIQSVFVDGANVPPNSSTDPNPFSLNSGGSSSLVTFLNDYYTGGFTAGDYLAIGLAMDLNSETYNDSGNYKMDFYPTSTGNENPSTGDLTSLSITAIPEPSTFALLAGTLGLGWVMLRRRRS